MISRAGGACLQLHIGRNKAGSTTLQSYFLQHAEEMRQAGVQYALFNQPAPPDSQVPVFANHRYLADFVRAQPCGSVLVSHEGLCCFRPDMIKIMADDLAGLDMQLIFYVRPYRFWVVSSYGFDVRTGINGRDIDRYIETIQPGTSFLPALEIWGSAIGWDRVRVRSLNARDLQDGDLVSDFLSAIGLPPPPPAQTRRRNVSPHWITIELLRLAVGQDSSAGWDHAGLAIAEALHELADSAIDACGISPAPCQYLTSRQAMQLAAQYNHDLQRIADLTGVRLSPDRSDAFPERNRLPSAASVPLPVMHMIRQRALAPDYARLHPEAADFVSSASFNALCEV